MEGVIRVTANEEGTLGSFTLVTCREFLARSTCTGYGFYCDREAITRGGGADEKPG
jgi:hypothetical protein